MEENKDFSKIPFIYLFIYKRLRESFNINQTIEYKALIYKINKVVCHIPRKDYDIIIKELVDYGLINKLSGKRAPKYNLNIKDYKKMILDVKSIEESTQRFKILKSHYEKLINKINEEEKFTHKYELLKCDYEKFLRKLELKKLEESHYW